MVSSFSRMPPSRTLYLVRHCRTTGQEPEAPLTPEGEQQARDLAQFLVPRGIGRIVSSPYTRAIASISPLATRLALPIQTDARLVERVLSPSPLPDWQTHLRASFDDLHRTLPGGESSHTAMTRALAAIQNALAGTPAAAAHARGASPAGPATALSVASNVSGSLAEESTVIVTHGNLLALILRHFDPTLGTFETWRALTNPDLFQVTYPPPSTSTPSSPPTVKRIWQA